MKLEMVIRDYWDEKDVTRHAVVSIPEDLRAGKDRLIWVINTTAEIERDYVYQFVVIAAEPLDAFKLTAPDLKEYYYDDYEERKGGEPIIWNITAIGVAHETMQDCVIAKLTY